jgi:hypothetical protein
MSVINEEQGDFQLAINGPGKVCAIQCGAHLYHVILCYAP